ncbi:hypothetical protein E2562_020727 [Oryza meyeriana var. granulata]|uniref:Uncharacterized protein n=1 Tax=Oryza meyeriana var. granulata TaxID=110450 RepID=A0A6G1EN71_9ORYZ|nr:hypothetical protein E2562_020727 [Oryza meyeriana var. granulata]
MESSRNGDVTVTYEQALFCRRRNGGGFATYLDLVREEGDAGQMAQRRSLPLPPHGAASRRRTYADGELDVFAAERPAWTTRASVASAGSGSTANSQTVLLREQRRRGKCCVHVGGILRSCSGKRSVHVDGGAMTTEPTAGLGDEPPAPASRIEWYRDLRMDKVGRLGLAGDGLRHGVVAAGLPPNLNVGAARVVAIGRDETTAAEYASASFRRNLTLLAPVKSLMIDDCPYEPSEASVQWSVVTASAADVSVASERGGVRAAGGNSGGKGRPLAVAVRQQQQRRQDRPVGLLTGCVSHRAVDVSAMASVRRPPPPSAAATRRRTDVSRFALNGHL